MEAKRMANGNILIPARVEIDNVIGDMSAEISPSHPDYKKWDLYLQSQKDN